MSLGVGLTVTLRVRMAPEHAHYGNDMCDNSHILALFGDVATELLVRLDGDEGQLRTYEAIEFLTPVCAGDFIEATGVVTQVGTTSRTIAFEARKVIANVRSPALAPTAADAFAEPLVVCRALGTCLVPSERQRRPRIVLPALSAPAPDHAKLPQPHPIITPVPHVIVTPPRLGLILTARIVAGETDEEQPGLMALHQIADEAALCQEAGASILHLQLQTPNGSPSTSGVAFAKAAAAIRQKTDLIVQTSTAGSANMNAGQRAISLLSQPEMATLPCGSVNYGDGILENPRPLIHELAHKIREAGSLIGFECYDASHLDEAENLVAKDPIAKPLHFWFVLGEPFSLAARQDVLQFLISQIPQGSLWTLDARQPNAQHLEEFAVQLGGNVCVSSDSKAGHTASAVARVAGYARRVGREVVEPDRARHLLGLDAPVPQ